MIRLMFINHCTKNDFTVDVTAKEKVLVMHLPLKGDAADQPRKTESKRWSLTLKPGEVRGFVTTDRLEYVNPDPSRIQVVTASNKDPWPPPPPPPPKFADRADFETRYHKFMDALGEDPKPDWFEGKAVTVTIEQ